MKAKQSDALKRINLLIEDGAKFGSEEGYDCSAVLEWIGAVSEVLCDFPNEQREFLLYCVTSCAAPPERVCHALWILRKVRDGLRKSPSE